MALENPANDRETLVDDTTSEPADIYSSGDMLFDCEMNLGVPSLNDCSQIQYSQLGAPSDSFNLGPGAAKTISQGTPPKRIPVVRNHPLTYAIRYLQR